MKSVRALPPNESRSKVVKAEPLNGDREEQVRAVLVQWHQRVLQEPDESITKRLPQIAHTPHRPRLQTRHHEAASITLHHVQGRRLGIFLVRQQVAEAALGHLQERGSQRERGAGRCISGDVCSEGVEDPRQHALQRRSNHGDIAAADGVARIAASNHGVQLTTAGDAMDNHGRIVALQDAGNQAADTPLENIMLASTDRISSV
mmetsp:Transcript_61296/g.198297  ORF Transcript_61296/g.198297 Transcript_61296/m.198297 type:complete len:204 (+) Transcript_61296:220-831(+)